MDLYQYVLLGTLAIPILYVAGLAFSRGYHKGKKEFVTEMMKDSLKEKENIDA